MSNWKIIVDGATKDFEDNYSFKVEQAPGTGMPPLDNISTPYGLLDGGLYQRTRAEARTFTLVGTLNGSSVNDLHLMRKNLIDAVKPDRTASPVPIEIRYTGGTGSTLQASAYYDAGFEFGTANVYTEAHLGARFVMLDPYWQATTATSTALTVRTEVTGNHILQRDADGAWTALGGGLTGTGTVGAIDNDSTGALYIAHSCPTVNGSAKTAAPAKWTGSDWELLAGSAGGVAMFDVAVNKADDSVYFGGIGNIGPGAANLDYLGKWDGSNWSDPGQPNTTVLGLKFGRDGLLYVTGQFETVNDGALTASRIATYNPDTDTWAVINSSSGPDGTCTKVAQTANLDVYISGCFNAIGACPASGMGRWVESSSIFDMPGGSTANDNVLSVFADVDGTIYAGGPFDEMGNVTACHVAQFNGTKWSAMADGLTEFGSTASVYAWASDSRNRIYAVGNFDKTGKRNLSDGHAIWRGSNWYPLDVELPGSGSTRGIHVSDTDVITIGFDSTGTASTAGVTTVTNNGTAKAYPQITASGPGQLYHIINFTTKDEIYFDLELKSGEVITVDLRPGKKTVVSNFRGNILDSVLPGSDITTWSLTTGSNSVGVYIDNQSASAALEWVSRYWSLDGGAT